MKKEKDKININLSEHAKYFLLYSYFNITKEDLQNEDTIITKCAQRAYLDLNRTLKFSCEYKDSTTTNAAEKNDRAKIRKKFRNHIICDIINKNLGDLMKSSSNDDYDEKHAQLCQKIKNEVNGNCVVNDKKSILAEGIEYGQAQKWLNMTIKYMWLLGLWNNEKNINYIHVPVDSYIIKAVWKWEDVSLPLLIPPKNRNFEYKNPAEHVKAWSQWNEKEYKNFQTSLREHLRKNPPIESPIEWEGHAWIEIAQERKSN